MKINNFFKLMFFEVKKIFRSKFVFFFLVFAPLIMSLFISMVCNTIDPLSNYKDETNSDIETDSDFQDTTMTNQIVFVSDGNVEGNATIDAIKNAFGSDAEISWKNDIKSALNDLKLSNISLIVYVDVENNITIYYDLANNLSTHYKDIILQKGYEFAYDSVKLAFGEWGITIDGFEVELDEAGDKEYPLIMRMEAISLSLIIGFLLTVGISYTTSRDNETGIIKQLSYTPMKSGKYITIRTVFFTFLLLLQIVVMMLVFQIMGSNHEGTFLGLLGITCLFGFAFMGLGFIFATTKNQLSTICLSIITIIVPAVIFVMGMAAVPVVFKAILYISPLTAFLQLFNAYINYGIINVLPLIILMVESIFYYFVSFIIYKLKIKRKLS